MKRVKSVAICDPAAAALNSCLRAFPGGVSLITESGLLRPFVFADTLDAVLTLAVPPLTLYKGKQEGAVDHAWSEDGCVLVVLFRANFSVYTRASNSLTSSLQSQSPLLSDSASTPLGCRFSSADLSREDCFKARPWSDLHLVHAENIAFEGKVTSCCKMKGAEGEWLRYLVVVGGSFGIKCYIVLLPSSQLNLFANPVLSEEESGGTMGTTNGASKNQTCRGSVKGGVSLFVGYPVVAVAFSPDSRLLAAASMTGHLQIWDVATVASSSEENKGKTKGASTRTRSNRRRNSSDRGKSGRQGFKGSDSQPTRGGRSDSASIWGITLSTPRVTSVSFSPNDNASLALACWDGQVLLFQPKYLDKHYNSCGSLSRPTPKNGGGEYWSQADNVEMPDKLSETSNFWQLTSPGGDWEQKLGDVSGEHPRDKLEDREGQFVCWVLSPLQEGNSIACLATTTVDISDGVHQGGCSLQSSGGQRVQVGNGIESEAGLSWSGGSEWVCCTRQGSGAELYDPISGKRLGGFVTSPEVQIPQPTAGQAYLIHGMACSGGFLSLYDSNCTLHVVGPRYLASLQNDTFPEEESASVGHATCPTIPENDLPGAPQVKGGSNTSDVRKDGHGSRREDYDGFKGGVGETKSVPVGRRVGCAESPPSTNPGRRHPGSLTGMITLADNEHGTVSIAQGVTSSQSPLSSPHSFPERVLKLSVVWRQVEMGPEEAEHRAKEVSREVPMLPSLSQDERGGKRWEVIGADIRWGWVAVFTRHVAVVYARGLNGISQNIGSCCQGREGSWKVYPGGWIDDGVLLGGGPLGSQNTLQEIYLATVCKYAGGRLSRVTVQSVTTRRKRFECILPNSTRELASCTDGCVDDTVNIDAPCVNLPGDADSDLERELTACSRSAPGLGQCVGLEVGSNQSEAFSGGSFPPKSTIPGGQEVSPACPADVDGHCDGCLQLQRRGEKDHRFKVHVPPGEGGGGSFVVADEGGARDCARLWHCHLDYGACRLEIGDPKTISSTPWPPPKSLHLVGVIGPDCELAVFEEVSSSCVQCSRVAQSRGEGEMRWWVSIPDLSAWRRMVIPVGYKEAFSLHDFVDLFNGEVKRLLNIASRSCGLLRKSHSLEKD